MKKIANFSQVASLISRKLVSALAQKAGSDRYSKGLDTYAHTNAMLFAHLTACNSLRDISNGLRYMLGRVNPLILNHAPSRNALSHQNAHRDWKVFASIYYALYNHLGQQLRFNRGLKLSVGKEVLLLDSSIITLCSSLFPWAGYQQEKGAIKMHTLFSCNTFLPLNIMVSDGKMADNIGAYGVFPDKRCVIVADRAYVDSELLYDWDSNGITFVVRFKKGINFERLHAFEQPDGTEQDILVDEMIKLTGEQTQENYNDLLRRIVVYRPYEQARKSRRKWRDASPELLRAETSQVADSLESEDDESEQVIEIITNNMEWSAETISKLYRSRWEIENFFKLIKQHLRIKSFFGTSQNAVMIQIWTAMIAVLLLRYLKSLSSHKWTMAALVIFLRISLLSDGDLFSWLDRPYDISREPPSLELRFS